jgi:hypothetical protein
MQVHVLTKEEFFSLAYRESGRFLQMIERPEIFIVRNLYNPEDILGFREQAFRKSLLTESSWHPCFDDVPDYHRLHDNYPEAYVKGKFVAHYYHGFFEKNNELFDYFKETFHLMNFLAGLEKNTFLKNIPSQGQIARILIHNYPRGGGYQAEHVDPVLRFALIQTLVVASKKGLDYKKGGLYVRESKDSEPFYLDSFTDIGDVMVFSPGIDHGVDCIDPSNHYNWRTNNGRWIIMPIIINSDYPHEGNIKPQEVVRPG